MSEPLSSPGGSPERDALLRICGSPEFAQSERMKALLQFLVETHLAGRAADLKESVIGVAVYGRDPSYNPKT